MCVLLIISDDRKILQFALVTKTEGNYVPEQCKYINEFRFQMHNV